MGTKRKPPRHCLPPTPEYLQKALAGISKFPPKTFSETKVERQSRMAENALRASPPLYRNLIAEYGLHRWHTERAYFAGAVTLVAVMLVASSTGQHVNGLVWGSYLALFIAGELFTGQVENGAWTGYPHIASLVLWLTGGLDAALSMTLVGSVLVGLLRLLFKNSIELPSVTWSQAASLAFGRIAVTGMAVIAAALVYGLAGFSPPLEALSIIQFVALVAALAAAWLVSQIVGLLLTSTFADQPVQQLRVRNQARFPLELLAAAVVITLALIANRIDSVPHAAVIALIIIQALRQRSTSHSDQLLQQRVEELSLLNQVGEVMASSLVTGDLLESIHTTLTKITGAPVLYLALYDPSHNLLDFAIATESNERVAWPLRHVNHSAASWVIRHKALLHLRAASADTLREMEILPTEYEQKYPNWLILPLLIGSEPVGVIGLMSNKLLSVFDPAGIALMEAIARQAALAIYNASLYRRSSELVEHLSLMNRSIEQMMTNVDRTGAVDRMCETTRKIGQADGITLHLVPQLGMQPQLVYASGLSAAQQIYAALPRDPFPEKIRLLPDIGDNAYDGALQRLAQQMGVRALVELPLRSTSTTRGFLTLYYAQSHYPQQTEFELLQMLSGQISTVIDNAELFNALETYAFEMAQLAHLSHVLTSDLDLNRVLADVTQVLSQVTLMTRVIVVLIDPQDNRLRVATNYTDPVRPPAEGGETLPEFPELTAFLASPHVQGRAFHADEVISPALSAWLRENGEATLALLPMRISGALIGVIMLGNHEKRLLTEREWQLAETAVNHVAGQIQNAQLYTSTQDALRQRLEQLALIEALAQQISSALDLDQIISTVLKAAAQSTQASNASLVLLPDDSNARSMVVKYVGGQLDRSFIMLAYDDSSIGQVIRSGRPVNIPDRRRTSVTGVLHGPNALSSLAVPLLTDHGVIGVLKVESERLNAFRDEHASFLSNLAGHAAISLGNAKMLEERHYQLNVMGSLHDLALRLSSATDTPSATNAILETTLDLFEGSLEAGLFQYEPKINRLALLAHRRRAPALPGQGARFPAAIAWEAAETGEIQIVRLSEDARTKTDSATIGCISVPLKRGNQVRQVLSIAFPGSRSFPKRDFDTLELLVGQAAGHLENVMLHEQVRAGHERLTAILNSARDGVILLDQKGGLIDTNPAARQMLGDELDTYLDQVIIDTPWKALTAASNGEAEAPPPARRQFQQGAMHLEEIGAPVTDAQGRPVGWLLALRDITEEKLLENYRDEISQMVVHDLRSPLAAIINSIQFSLEEIRKYGGLQSEANTLALADESAHRLMLLVESMLSIAKLEARQLQLNIDALPLEILVEKAAVTFAATLQQLNITLRRELPPDLPWLHVDGELIGRVLMNLLANALHHTPPDNAILITAEWHESEGHVLVRVADSGRGIPMEERTQIFEKFKQAKGSVPTGKRQGTGLGLTFCKLVVEAHGGRIWVEDESPLDGACFALTLPAEPI